MNPDPPISTRGLGKYLVDTVLRKSGTIDEQRRTLDKSPLFDLGVRGQRRDMHMNPLREIALRYGKGSYGKSGGGGGGGAGGHN